MYWKLFLSAHRYESYINTLFVARQNVLMKFKVPYYVHFPSDRLECEDFLYSFILVTSKFRADSELTNEDSTVSFCPLLSKKHFLNNAEHLTKNRTVLAQKMLESVQHVGEFYVLLTVHPGTTLGK